MSGWPAIAAQGRLALQRQMAAWRDPVAAGRASLQRLLTLTETSAFGVEHGLRAGMTLDEWRGTVPVRDAADFGAWCDRIIAGERKVLTDEPVLAFELTGGSSGGRRVVPYTASLLADFQELLSAWFGDLLAIGCAATFACVMVLLRRLKNQDTVPQVLFAGLWRWC
ncbi:MAG: GH3 auxin-responsive promoter family protein [Tabrizicola sp.]|nr:GH3 auxin-responsive promoter family protein [Tabrizicola sp.]